MSDEKEQGKSKILSEAQMRKLTALFMETKGKDLPFERAEVELLKLVDWAENVVFEHGLLIHGVFTGEILVQLDQGKAMWSRMDEEVEKRIGEIFARIDEEEKFSQSSEEE